MFLGMFWFAVLAAVVVGYVACKTIKTKEKKRTFAIVYSLVSAVMLLMLGMVMFVASVFAPFLPHLKLLSTLYWWLVQEVEPWLRLLGL